MPDPASTKQTTADFVKNDAIWLRVMVDDSDVASDRDSAERLWPETRDNLYDIAATLEALAADNARLRYRMFGLGHIKGHNHSTGCTIWGDDGKGGTNEGFDKPLSCNCGALINWHKELSDKLQRDNARLRRIEERAEAYRATLVHGSYAELSETDVESSLFGILHGEANGGGGE